MRADARRALCALLVLVTLAFALAFGTAGRDVAVKRAPPAAQIDLQTRLKDVEVALVRGQLGVTVATDEGPRFLTPQAYVDALQSAQEAQKSHGILYVLFNITKPWSLAWIAVGFLGQALFTFRMVLQWWASEKHKRSIVPVGFWWGSLFGGMLLFAYFVWRKDIVGIVGQSTGVFVYARNLILIYSRPSTARELQAAAPASTEHTA
jgi:lipid-A-disaccharide synthase-like uncharacterized protein